MPGNSYPAFTLAQSVEAGLKVMGIYKYEASNGNERTYRYLRSVPIDEGDAFLREHNKWFT